LDETSPEEENECLDQIYEGPKGRKGIQMTTTDRRSSSEENTEYREDEKDNRLRSQLFLEAEFHPTKRLKSTEFASRSWWKKEEGDVKEEDDELEKANVEDETLIHRIVRKLMASIRYPADGFMFLPDE
jgi:hypothetical protein